MVDDQAVVVDHAADDTRSASLSLPRPRTVLIGGIVGLTCGVEELRLRGGSVSRRVLLGRTAIGCVAAAVHSACEPAARRAVARASAQTTARGEWAASVLVGGGVLGAGALLARRAGARKMVVALPLLVIPSFYATLITRENLVMLRATRPVVADALAASSLAALPAGLLCWPPPLLALLLPALVLPPACHALDDVEHRHEPPPDDVRAALVLHRRPLASLPAARPLYALQQQRADDAPPPMVVVAAVAPATEAEAETAADDVNVASVAAGGGSRVAAARDAARHAMAQLLEARDASVTRGARALFGVIGAMDGRRVTVVEAAEAVVVVPREDVGADSAAAERACAAIAEAVRTAEDDGDDDSLAAHPLLWAVGGTAAVDLRELRAALDGALLEAQEALRDARPPQPSLAQRAAEWAAVPWRPSWRGGGGDVGGGGGGGDGGAAASLAGLLELRGGATAALSAAARADALRRLGWLRETLGPVVESRVANRLPLVEGEAVRAAAAGFESWVLPPDVVGNDECCEGLVFVAADARNNLLWTRPVGWFRWFASGDLCLLALLLALKELA